jgi:thymidylate synthase (FAD)
MQTAPAVFKNAGPGCIRGKCPEGEKSCGHASEVRGKYEKILLSATEA